MFVAVYGAGMLLACGGGLGGGPFGDRGAGWGSDAGFVGQGSTRPLDCFGQSVATLREWGKQVAERNWADYHLQQPHPTPVTAEVASAPSITCDTTQARARDCFLQGRAVAPHAQRGAQSGARVLRRGTLRRDCLGLRVPAGSCHSFHPCLLPGYGCIPRLLLVAG